MPTLKAEILGEMKGGDLLVRMSVDEWMLCNQAVKEWQERRIRGWAKQTRRMADKAMAWVRRAG